MARRVGDLSARGRAGGGGRGREGDDDRGGGGGERDSDERGVSRGRDKGMGGGGGGRKGSPPPFVGPKGVYKDGKSVVGRGVGAAQDFNLSGEFVVSKTGLWTRVGRAGRSRSVGREARGEEGRATDIKADVWNDGVKRCVGGGGKANGERRFGAEEGSSERERGEGGAGDKGGGGKVSGGGQGRGRDDPLRSVSEKQDDWLESCIEMISGLVNRDSPSPAHADAQEVEDDEYYDHAFGREVRQVRNSAAERGATGGAGAGGVGGIGGGAMGRNRLGIGSPNSAHPNSAHPAALHGRRRTLPDTSPRWDTEPGTRGSLRHQSAMPPPMDPDYNDTGAWDTEDMNTSNLSLDTRSLFLYTRSLVPLS